MPKKTIENIPKPEIPEDEKQFQNIEACLETVGAILKKIKEEKANTASREEATAIDKKYSGELEEALRSTNSAAKNWHNSIEKR